MLAKGIDFELDKRSDVCKLETLRKLSPLLKEIKNHLGNGFKSQSMAHTANHKEKN